MTELKDLDRIGMTGARTFAYAVLMPLAAAALIYGVFNIGVSLAIGARTKPAEWITLAIGLVGVPLVLRLKGGAGKFRRLLEREPRRVARLVTHDLTAAGLGMGRSVGYARLYDARGKLLAQVVVNDVGAFAAIRAIVARVAPGAQTEELTETMRIGVAGLE